MGKFDDAIEEKLANKISGGTHTSNAKALVVSDMANELTLTVSDRQVSLDVEWDRAAAAMRARGVLDTSVEWQARWKRYQERSDRQTSFESSISDAVQRIVKKIGT
jgi:hypothetical protein